MNCLAAITINEPAVRLLLLLLLVVPLIGVALMPFTRPDRRHDSRNLALVISLATLAFAVLVLAVHLMDPAALDHPPGWLNNWLQVCHSSLALGVDGISIWLVLLAAVLVPLAVLASSHAIRSQVRTYYGLLLLLESAMLGVFLARDLLWFYLCFEFTLVPLYFIIGLWGGPLRKAAAYKFFVYTMAGSMLTLAGLLYMGFVAGRSLGPPGSVNFGSFSFDEVAAATMGLPAGTQMALFVALFAGFAIKVPLFPLHTWLPLAHTEAPTAGSVLLAGVLLKLGTYGFLRIGVAFLPLAALRLAPVMGVLAAAGILYGALGAWVQSDIKKLVAYSSIAHLGFCMLGMFALRSEGLTGSVLVMVNHGLSTGALFIVVGMIYDRYHTRRFDDLGGLGRRMPVISFFLVLFALSSLGLPGLNGFVSEFLVLLGAVLSGRAGEGLPPVLGYPYAVPAALGVILSAVYLLYLVGRVVFGPLKEPPVHDQPGEEKLPADATVREWVILAPLAVLVVVLGVWPAPLTRSMREPVDRILAGVRDIVPPAANASARQDESVTRDVVDSCEPRPYPSRDRKGAGDPHVRSLTHAAREEEVLNSRLTKERDGVALGP